MEGGLLFHSNYQERGGGGRYALVLATYGMYGVLFSA